MSKLLILLLFINIALHAESKYPVDISYMVADLKYSQEHGVKICEMQHGILSTFFGDAFLNGDLGLICPQIAQAFSEFEVKKWMVSSHVSFQNLVVSLENSPSWKKKSSLESLIQDPEFKNAATQAPVDPNCIASYKGMMYARPAAYKKNYNQFRKQYPGILIIDAPTHPYWVDKYKMTRLFKKNKQLSQIKPEWGLYPKKYSSALSKQILEEIPSEAFVIKPRGAFLGHGVIIVSKEDLDSTLQYILTKNDSLLHNPDKSYSHWYKDRFDSFIVEKYYPSDIVQVEEMEGKFFEPTMRVAVMMIYNNKKIDVRFIGGYWMLPFKSLDETGSLNELKKAYCKPPFYIKVPNAILQEVRKQLESTLPLFYQQMLEN